jgi:hypothetical protein
MAKPPFATQSEKRVRKKKEVASIAVLAGMDVES